MPTVEYYNANDGLKGRDPDGIYLDRIEMEQAEVQRAKRERRKPDLVNPPATAGTVLVTEERLIDNSKLSNTDLVNVRLKDSDGPAPSSTITIRKDQVEGVGSLADKFTDETPDTMEQLKKQITEQSIEIQKLREALKNATKTVTKK